MAKRREASVLPILHQHTFHRNSVPLSQLYVQQYLAFVLYNAHQKPINSNTTILTFSYPQRVWDVRVGSPNQSLFSIQNSFRIYVRHRYDLFELSASCVIQDLTFVHAYVFHYFTPQRIERLRCHACVCCAAHDFLSHLANIFPYLPRKWLHEYRLTQASERRPQLAITIRVDWSYMLHFISRDLLISRNKHTHRFEWIHFGTFQYWEQSLGHGEQEFIGQKLQRGIKFSLTIRELSEML